MAGAQLPAVMILYQPAGYRSDLLSCCSSDAVTRSGAITYEFEHGRCWPPAQSMGRARRRPVGAAPDAQIVRDPPLGRCWIPVSGGLAQVLSEFYGEPVHPEFVTIANPPPPGYASAL
jgi:hypothetical protein